MNKIKFICLSVGVVIAIGLAGLLLFCHAVRTNVASRVPIPGTAITAVVFADVSGSYFCQLFEKGKPISELRTLGPYASRYCSAKLTSISNFTTIEWVDGNYHYSATVDIQKRQFRDPPTNTSSVSH